MGWDDEDDWDADDIEAKLEAQRKEKERERRLEEGLDSQSEDEAPKGAPSPQAKPKPKPKKGKKEEEQKEAEPALTGEALKLKLREDEEKRDAKLAGDLFLGFEIQEAGGKATPKAKAKAASQEQPEAEPVRPRVITVDAFDKVELNLQADVEKLCETCVEKINGATAKGAAPKFLTELLKQVESSLSLKELGDLEKLMAEVVKEKKNQTRTDMKDNKANTKISKTTKFNASSAWEEVYGGGEGDEHWTQEEWDEWEKSQAEAWEASQKK